jgi:hypothetical protein
MIETVTLRNGKEAQAPAVSAVFVALRRLFETDALAFYELVTACRDSSHVIFSEPIAATLTSFALLESVNADGTARIHDLTRDVVVASVEGSDFEMRLRWPVETAETDQ